MNSSTSKTKLYIYDDGNLRGAIDATTAKLCEALNKLGYTTYWRCTLQKKSILQQTGQSIVFINSIPQTIWQKILTRLKQRFSLFDFIDFLFQGKNSLTLVPWSIGVRPLPRWRNYALIVHDLNWNSYPENWKNNSPSSLNQELGTWIKNSRICFAISDFVKGEILDLFPEFKSKIETLHWANEPIVRDSKKLNRREFPENDYILCVGRYAPHKGQHLLCNAVLELRKKGYNIDLVLVGYGINHLKKTLSEDLTGVYTMEGLESSEITWLYEEAKVVCIPSKYEGFGLALSEALYSNANVVCSDIGPFLEQIKMLKTENVKTFRSGNLNDLVRCLSESLTLENKTIDEHNFRTWTDVANEFHQMVNDHIFKNCNS